MPVKVAFELLSPGQRNGRLSILIFHRVLAQVDPLFPEEVDAARFDVICGWLRRWFNVLPLDAAVRRLRDGSLPRRAAAITFDDGYADNHDIALPILKKHGLPSTFFIATGFLDGGCMWNDTVIEAIRRCERSELSLDEAVPGTHPLSSASDRRGLIDRLLPAIKHLPLAERRAAAHRVTLSCGVSPSAALMMTSAQVQGLHRAGMQIGAHTVNHPILAVLDEQEAHAEIAQSKQRLESLIDKQVTLFAYPNGRPAKDYSASNVDTVRRCGFDAAVSTGWGAARSSSDLYQLPRFTPWDRARVRFGMRLASNLLRS